MAAVACFKGKSSGLLLRPIRCIPAPIAPEETKTISFPELFKSVKTRASFSILSKLTFPFSWVKDDVPILIIIRFAAFTLALIQFPSFHLHE